MATAKKSLKGDESTLTLNNGDRMEQPEFHMAYDAMPECYRAELIGGIVFEPSPAGYEHGRHDTRLVYLLEHYAAVTTGVETAGNATVILSKKDELQPDVLLRIMPGSGGSSHNMRIKDKLYVQGAPELVAEVAHSSRAIDLHLKKSRYSLGGVQEYIVLCLCPLQLYWFHLVQKKSLAPDSDGIVKSIVFPGLWIDQQALIRRDYAKSIDALNKGMQTSEYLKFVSKLANSK